MAANPLPQGMTFSEFLDFEAQSDTRHEFDNGLVKDIPEAVDSLGATGAHGRLQAQLSHLLLSKQAGCAVYGSSVSIYDALTGQSKYPDLSVACAPQYFDPDQRALLNPQIVFEVLSPSTADKDQGEKMSFYKQIPNLQAIVLVDSQRHWVQVNAPLEGRWWRSGIFTEGNDVIDLSICSLTLIEMYSDILPFES